MHVHHFPPSSPAIPLLQPFCTHVLCQQLHVCTLAMKKTCIPLQKPPHAMYAADESVLGKYLSCSRTSCFRLFQDNSFLFSSNSQSHRSCITQLFSVYSSR